MDGPIRILVVDDDEAGRYMLRTLLHGEGYDVLVAADGEEALQVARREVVDLVITDILMPRKDGYRLAREMKADGQLRATPFIFYTATYTDPADERFALDLGAERFVSKPAEPGELLDVVREVLEGLSGRSAAPRQPRIADESDVLREYSERLVNKLEQKIVELGEANDGLHIATEALSEEIGVKSSLIQRLDADIESRERAEAELRGANEMLGAVIGASPLAVTVFEPGGDTTMWNAAAERTFGWSADEVLGRPNPFVPPELVGEWPSIVSACLGASRVEGISVAGVRKDGGRVQLQVWVSAVHAGEDAASRLLLVAQDITERAAVEKLKSDFLSMVSHELRTPLTGIIGYLDLLRGGKAMNDPAIGREFAARAREKAEELRELVDRLLEISSLHAGAIELTVRRVDAGAMIRSIVDGSEVPDTHRVSIETAGEALAVTCDPARVGRAFKSLLSNAVKYSPEGGPIEVAVRRLGDRVRISVADHGVGMEPDVLDSIFGMFTQHDMSSTRRFGGAGIGLYVAKQFVEAHGARLEVESVPGEGSTFTIDMAAAVGG
jgi:PAS domain S-box-containing protein